MKKQLKCPCDNHSLYQNCCEPYHLWQKNAQTAEVLMRTRYSAYALNKIDYIIKTWHPKTLPSSLEHEIYESKWIELCLHKSWADNESEAFVSFTAKYRDKSGRAGRLNEVSKFIKQGEHWFYYDGQITES